MPSSELIEKIKSYPHRSLVPGPLSTLQAFTKTTISDYLYQPEKRLSKRFTIYLQRIHENRDLLDSKVLPVGDRYIIEDFLDHLFVEEADHPFYQTGTNPHSLASSLGNYPDKPMTTVPPLASYKPPPTGGGQTLSQSILDHFDHINTCVEALDIRRAVFLHFTRASNSSLGTRNYWPPKFAYHGPSYLAKQITADPRLYADTYWAVCHALRGRAVLPALYHTITSLLDKMWSKWRTLPHDPVPYPVVGSSLDKFIDGPGNLLFNSQNYLAARHYNSTDKAAVATDLAYSTPGEKIARDWGLVTKFLGSPMYHWLCGMTLYNPVAYLDSVSGEYTRESRRVKIYKDDVPLYDWRKVFLGKRDPNIYEIIILMAVWVDSHNTVDKSVSDSLLADLGIDLGPLLVDGGSTAVRTCVWGMGAQALVEAGMGGIADDTVSTHRVYGRYLTTELCLLLDKDIHPSVENGQSERVEFLSFRPHRSIEMDAQRTQT